jgi:hypothetical protein
MLDVVWKKKAWLLAATSKNRVLINIDYIYISFVNFEAPYRAL